MNFKKIIWFTEEADFFTNLEAILKLFNCPPPSVSFREEERGNNLNVVLFQKEGENFLDQQFWLYFYGMIVGNIYFYKMQGYTYEMQNYDILT